jgi:hypothetical protein
MFDKGLVVLHSLCFLVYLVQGITQLVLEFAGTNGARDVFVTSSLAMGGVGFRPNVSSPIEDQVLKTSFSLLYNYSLTGVLDGYGFNIPYPRFSPIALTGTMLLCGAIAHLCMLVSGFIEWVNTPNVMLQPPFAVSLGRQLFFSFTSTFMTVIVAIVCGIQNLSALLFLAGLQLAVCALGHFIAYLITPINYSRAWEAAEREEEGKLLAAERDPSFIADIQRIERESADLIYTRFGRLTYMMFVVMCLLSSIQWISIGLSIWTVYIQPLKIWPLYSALIVVNLFHTLHTLLLMLRVDFSMQVRETVYVLLDIIGTSLVAWVVFLVLPGNLV